MPHVWPFNASCMTHQCLMYDSSMSHVWLNNISCMTQQCLVYDSLSMPHVWLISSHHSEKMNVSHRGAYEQTTWGLSIQKDSFILMFGWGCSNHINSLNFMINSTTGLVCGCKFLVVTIFHRAGLSYVKLIQARVIWKKGASNDKMPSGDLSAGNFIN